VTRRRLVAVLLVAAAVLFGIGTSYEAAERSEHLETEVAETAAGGEKGERILGIDATSPVVIGLGILLSLGAAAAIVRAPRRPVDLGIAGFAAVFGVLDLAEALHGLREDEVAIGILALIVGSMHLGAAWLASTLESHHVSATEPA
jgi:hypothetical protein